MTIRPLRDAPPPDPDELRRLEAQAVDLAEAGKPKREPAGWNAGSRRIKDAGGDVEGALMGLAIYTPDEVSVVLERALNSLSTGIEHRVRRRLGPLRFLVRRNMLRSELVTFAYANAISLAVIAVEAERERKGRRKAGHR